MKKIILIILVLTLCISCKNNEETEEIKEYKVNMICKQTLYDDIDDSFITSNSTIYINYNHDNYVVDALYQSVSDINNYSNNLIKSIDEVITIYNSIDGINARRYFTKNNFILEIKYDYMKININELNNKLDNLLDDNSIFKQSNKLPISLDEFKSIELKGYECK